MLDQKLLAILVCPICKGELKYRKEENDLVCHVDKLAYPIRDDVPVMLAAEARTVSSAELERLR